MRNDGTGPRYDRPRPAKVVLPDGSSPPIGDDGIPVLTGYDPGEHTVAEVQTYLTENPDQADEVLDRERAGRARISLIGA